MAKDKSTSSLHKVAHRVGRRGTFLLFLALLDFIYAYALAAPTARAASNPTYVFLAAVMPLGIWAALWAIVGTICLVFAFRTQDAPGYAAAMFVKILWAVTFLLGWIFADVERGYLSTAIWGAFAAVLALISTWPEPEPGKGTHGPAERAKAA
jgi:hypothetical protein